MQIAIVGWMCAKVARKQKEFWKSAVGRRAHFTPDEPLAKVFDFSERVYCTRSA